MKKIEGSFTCASSLKIENFDALPHGRKRTIVFHKKYIMNQNVTVPPP